MNLFLSILAIAIGIILLIYSFKQFDKSYEKEGEEIYTANIIKIIIGSLILITASIYYILNNFL